MDIKKTTTTKMDIKKCHYEPDGVLVDENGAEIDVNSELHKFFGEADAFNITATLKMEEDLGDE